MKIALRIPDHLMKVIHVDLSRPHRFAFERVGFVGCREAALPGGVAFLAEAYFPVADLDYLESNSVGALMGPAAIRKALQLAYDRSYSMFHIHRHEHRGKPKFSPLDLRESAKFVPNFWNVRPNVGHGALVLSYDSMFGLAWDPVDKRRKPIQEFTVVGRPLKSLGGRYG
jgi:hypothetical protein